MARWWAAGAVVGASVLVLVAALVLVVVEPGSGRARADDRFSMVVVGDSITANYNDQPGSPMQGWWSFVSRELGYVATVLAEGGSGFQRPGLNCDGTTFGDRPEVFEQDQPDLVIVEGGRNDWARCEGTNLVEVEPDVVRAAADAFLARLTEAYPEARIVVLAPPWGRIQQQHVARVTAAVETAAAHHGLEYVSMDGVLPESRTPDGLHPDISGSRAIAERVLEALDAG